MKNFVIKKFTCGTLTQLSAKIIQARNVDQARAQAEITYKPTRRQFVAAEAVRYR